MRHARAAWGSLRHLGWSLERQLTGVHRPCGATAWLNQPFEPAALACAADPQLTQVRGMAYRLGKPARDQYTTPPKNYVQLLQHIHHAYNLDKLYNLMRVYRKKFDSIHVAAAMSQVPKLYRPIQPGDKLPKAVAKARIRQPAVMLAELQDMAALHPDRLFTREIANIFWALGRCRSLVESPQEAPHVPLTKTRKLVKTLLKRLKEPTGNLQLLHPASTNGRDVSQLLYGLARLRTRDAKIFKRLERVMYEKAAVFEPKEIALIMWALGKLGWRPHYDIMDRLLGRVGERYLYLRPVTMTALLGGLVRLQYRNAGGLGPKITEVALDQMSSFTPRLLAPFTRYLALSPAYTPPSELLAAINLKALQQLEQYKGLELGLLLQGLAQMKGLGGELAEAVAAGIAAEEKVKVSGADAHRILSAFVRCSEIDLDSEDVQRMSLLISQALIKPASRGRILPRNLVGLSICFSKIGSCDPVLLDLFGESIVEDIASAAAEGPTAAAAAGGEAGEAEGKGKDEEALPKSRYELGDLIDVLQSFNRLGHVHEELCSAVNTQLHLAVKCLTEGGEQDKEEATEEQQGQRQEQQHVKKQRQLQQQQKLQDTMIDAAQELAAARRLRPEVAGALAAALVDQLESLKPRKLTMLLQALSSKGDVLWHSDVREFFQKVPGWLQQVLDGQGRQELGQMSLAGLPVAVAAAVDQGVIAGSGPQLVVQLLERVEPVVGSLSKEQVLGLMKACRTVGGEQGEQMQQQLKEVAGQRRWVVE